MRSVIELAKEAGDWNGQTAEFNDVGLERFAALVRAEYETPLKLAEEALESCDAGDYSTGHVIPPSFNDKAVDKALAAIREALADHVKQEPKCSDHPDAPHGFDRNASHNADRYVCECEGWEPPKQEPVAWRCRYCNTDMPTEHASDCPIEICRLPNANAAPVSCATSCHDAKAIRAEALEEAAKVCDWYAKLVDINYSEECAAAIRGLK